MTRAATNELTKCIQENGKTIDEVAMRMRVSRQTIQMWANRGIPLVRTKKLAKILGIKVEDIPSNHYDLSPNVKPRGRSVSSASERMKRVEENYKKKCEKLTATAQKLHENFIKERDNLREELRKEIQEMEELMNNSANRQMPIVIQPRE